MPPKIKRVSKYALGKTLGQGTFGKVKYAVDTETNCPVAMKIMDKQKIKTAKLGPQIKKEIRVMKMLTHQTCIKLVEVLASEDNIFLVLELVSGGELFDRVVANGRFSEAEARTYFTQLIEGLEHCHNLGVCHRDLKPENLLLDAHGGLKITDFGLASINETPDTPQILHTPCGTPNYVAPEVLMEKGYDGRLADIWSAGVILYLLVSGFLPFDEAQMVDLFRKIVVADYQYPSWLSHEVQTLIGKMLEPNTDRRATIDDIKSSAWYRGEIQSNKRKFPLTNDTNSTITDQTTGSFDEEAEDCAHVLHYDDDQLIFGPSTFHDTSPELQLLLTRQLSAKLGANQDHNYQFKKDPQGQDTILVGEKWLPIRDWFYSKYPGKRSVIDERVRRQRRAARKAAQVTPISTTSSSLLLLTPQTSTPMSSDCNFATNNTSILMNNPQTNLNYNGLIVPDDIPLSPSSSANNNLNHNHNEPDNGDGEDINGEPEVLAPKHLNAFDLINMVSGQSVNNMLLFNSENNSTTVNGKSPAVGIVKSEEGDVAGLKSQLKQTQSNHQQQSFTQFTSKCPTSLLIRRLDYVLLHIPNLKYRINYRKCHINAVWTNVRNQHQVHEFIEIYSLTEELHMVRCQRMTGSGIAHGDFYRIFKENVKFLEAHSNLAKGQPPAGINSNSNAVEAAKVTLGGDNNDILISTPIRPKRAVGENNPNGAGLYITANDIESYLAEWSQDVLIYKDYLLKLRILDRQRQEDSGDVLPASDGIAASPGGVEHVTSPTSELQSSNQDNAINSSEPVDIAGSPTHLDGIAETPTSKPTGNFTSAQMEKGLNTFRSLTLNSKSITLGQPRQRGTSVSKMVATSPTTPAPVDVVGNDGVTHPVRFQINMKDKEDLRHAQSSSSDDDDSSSSSEEDE